MAHSVFGVARTINSANYVYFLALDDLRHMAPEKFADASRVFTGVRRVMSILCFNAEQMCELHRGQGLDIYWRDSVLCPTMHEYEEMVKKSWSID